jgi:hypothetical protein
MYGPAHGFSASSPPLSFTQDVTILMERFRRRRGYGPHGSIEVKVELVTPTVATITFIRPPLRPSIFDSRRVMVAAPGLAGICSVFEVTLSGGYCSWAVSEHTLPSGGTSSSSIGRLPALPLGSGPFATLQLKLLQGVLVQLRDTVVGAAATHVSPDARRRSTGPTGGGPVCVSVAASTGVGSLVECTRPSWRFVDDVSCLLDIWGSLELHSDVVVLPARGHADDDAGDVAGMQRPPKEVRLKPRCGAAIFLSSGAVALPPPLSAVAATFGPRSVSPQRSVPPSNAATPSTASPTLISGPSAAVAPVIVTTTARTGTRGPLGNADSEWLPSVVCGGCNRSGVPSPSRSQTEAEGILPRRFVARVTLCGVCPVNALVANAAAAQEVMTATGASENIGPLFHYLAAALEGAIRDGGQGYLKRVLAPALVNVVRAMARQREPFWAGVCVCCVLLPGILGSKLNWLKLSSLPIQLASVVAAVVLVFRLLGDPVRSLEAATALEAIEAAHRAASGLRPGSSDPSSASPGSGDGSNYPAAPRNSSFAAYHKHISACAVCGLSVQRTRLSQHLRGTFAAPGVGMLLDGGGGVDEGALLVQCIYCGHGGHVTHIQSWREESSACPVGTCKCDCRYA